MGTLLLILVALAVVAALYSSVGHGGASGYLAVLSLTSYAAYGALWLRPHALCLNVCVASIGFLLFSRQGHHDRSLTIPLLLGSVPAAFLGGSLSVSEGIYDTLLSFVLVWAAWRLWLAARVDSQESVVRPTRLTGMATGAGIGLLSGVVGVGGGIFLAPIVLLKGWATPKETAATSAGFILANSLAGLAGIYTAGSLSLDGSLLVWFAVSVVMGGSVGARYGALIAKQETVRRILSVVLLVAASRRVLGLLLWTIY